MDTGSELERIYQEVAEDGRLDRPPSSPAEWVDWGRGGEERDWAEGAAPAARAADDSRDELIEAAGADRLGEVYDELGEGSVRIPGTRRESVPPDEDDESWLSTEQLLPG